MSKSPSRLLAKAILMPSGDQLGSWLKPPTKVSRLTSLPSGSIEKIALVNESTARVNAMRPFSPGSAPQAGVAQSHRASAPALAAQRPARRRGGTGGRYRGRARRGNRG
jgi:hypothetical protein